ncbi:hypothetical protein EDD18DRAFT_1190434 [Armillaria luteobubalina]|uniref:F-box domain-containing protein n=1 Tax=Armillaria luteobubalina TaxID=153913 RepID=A0AA39UGD9_9AGAR|nr:hypothetical protein EDD18DRAFT_1190434 [Armillaria luteobubalina]
MTLHSDSTHAPPPLLLSRDRIKALLRCNDPLLEAEKTALRSLVDEAPSTLANLDQQIIEARQILDSLIQKRPVAESDFDDAKTLLHPIRSMPHDVLREIFHYCVHDWEEIISGTQTRYDSLDPHFPPWTVSHVSMAWRDVSLSYPYLWTCIKLDFRNYGALNMRAIMTKVSILLERSKNMDLSVTLLSPDTPLSDHPAFALLDLSAPRWRKFAAAIQPPCLQALSGTYFNRLQKLLVVVPSVNRNIMTGTIKTFQKTPSLRWAAIRGDETWDSFPLPWSSIETYVCDSLRRIHWDRLKRLKALKSLEITNRSQFTFNPSELTQITLPTVTSLRISQHRPVTGSEMTTKVIQSNLLVLPSLSTLDIHFRRDKTPVFPFSHQLPASLTTLVLRDAMEHPDGIQIVLEFLETVPRVHTLGIDGRRGEEFFQGLSIQPGKDVILPNLRNLQLQGHRQPFPDSVVLDFLESRCRRHDVDGGHGTTHEENPGTNKPQPVFLEQIDLSEVELVPEYRHRLNDLRQTVKIIYTC